MSDYYILIIYFIRNVVYVIINVPKIWNIVYDRNGSREIMRKVTDVKFRFIKLI